MKQVKPQVGRKIIGCNLTITASLQQFSYSKQVHGRLHPLDMTVEMIRIHFCTSLWCSLLCMYENIFHIQWRSVIATTSTIKPWSRSKKDINQILTSVSCVGRFLFPPVSDPRRRSWNIYPLKEVYRQQSTLDALEKTPCWKNGFETCQKNIGGKEGGKKKPIILALIKILNSQ